MSQSCPHPDWPLAGVPQPEPAAPPLFAPTMQECHELWDKYQMLPNIRRHSVMVAHIARVLAARAVEVGIKVHVDAVFAAGLLHDIAKTWCVANGGSHDMIGASWVVQETGNYAVAQGVLLHVYWPWPLPKGNAICCLPLFVQYADKRARHDKCVTLEERFEDLQKRYGKTAKAARGIEQSYEQARQIENALALALKWDLHENTFDSGRLVHGEGSFA